MAPCTPLLKIFRCSLLVSAISSALTVPRLIANNSLANITVAGEGEKKNGVPYSLGLKMLVNYGLLGNSCCHQYSF